MAARGASGLSTKWRGEAQGLYYAVALQLFKLCLGSFQLGVVQLQKLESNRRGPEVFIWCKKFF
jgi:hypothetical protein